MILSGNGIVRRKEKAWGKFCSVIDYIALQ